MRNRKIRIRWVPIGTVIMATNVPATSALNSKCQRMHGYKVPIDTVIMATNAPETNALSSKCRLTLLPKVDNGIAT